MFNNFFLSHDCLSKASLAFLIIGLLINLNCGKRKPPLPPVENINQRIELAAKQKGNLIILTWKLPAKNPSNNSTSNISRADVYRLAEPLSSPLLLSEEEFASRSTRISSIEITEKNFQTGQISINDTLKFSGQKARLRYAVRFVNKSGQKASFSNFLLIEPTAGTSNSPTALRAETLEEAVVLKWNAPTENIDETQPVNIIGYNIYRSDEVNTVKVLNSQPLKNDNFKDSFFEFGKNYTYFVRAVSLGSYGEPIESADSNLIEVTPKDVFAPSPPNAVTIAAVPDNLSIFFAVNAEKDIAGYKVYRSNDSGKPLSEWDLMTRELLETNTFQDRNVTSGTTYFYYLVAVDKAGNISENSTVVSETAP